MSLGPGSLDDDNGTVFRDVITLALAGFVVMVILVLPHINPKVPNSAEAALPGNVVVEARWPDGIDTDVDLWVQAPGDVPVGYSNKGGRIFNLLRDDLGNQGDEEPLNYEVSYSRGLPAGEYTVNLHLYRNAGGPDEVPVDVRVGVKPTPADGVQRLAETRVTLKRLGQERTAVRFRLDAAGKLVPGSINSLQRPLRSGAIGG